MSAFVFLLSVSAAAQETARVYRKADGTVCMVSVAADGTLAESCEEAPERRPDLVPRSPPARAPTYLDRVSSASVKHGWSGALKVGAVTSGVGALAYYAIGDGTTGTVFLAVTAIDIAIALLIDGSAAGDMREAEQLAGD